ncbi:hypothetical protein MLPF_1074 [Mycobacterium lepromatosis]|nr:hypothetical protein MLPF_1074 [Mycobacterium lepromatosis]
MHGSVNKGNTRSASMIRSRTATTDCFASWTQKLWKATADPRCNCGYEQVSPSDIQRRKTMPKYAT